MAFKTLPTYSPLTDAEVDRLEEFLKRCQEKDDSVAGLEELDGFLAAILAGPEMVMPSEYLAALFGENAEIFETDQEAEEILGLIFRHHNFIAETLKRDEPYMPIFTEFDGDLPFGNQWAHGFLRGALLSFEAWQELMEDEEHGGCLLPMLILEHEHDPDPELRPPPIDRERREDLLAHMAAGVLFAYRYFKKQREEAAEAIRDYSAGADYFEDEIPLQVIRPEPKVGRNEMCPCGSGKKYKRCHGAVVVQ